jgi:hypothetical protein
MIDNLALLLSHGLLMLTAWRLLHRTELNREGPAPARRATRTRRRRDA